ncbi:MopE-related protein [Vibrio hannami]|uniref:MopE-related protein n=1 Tax=Vibrio hannami TaxID=2717094 RepID=UPI00240FB45D|nr:MopE-related protein [Vibrio hannami]MDG3085742.1 MopE-related protein [Vibrio hannami]
MKLGHFFVFILYGVATFGANSAPQTSDNIREAGDIIGSLSQCSQSTQDMEVYIRGTSYRSSTDGNGNFKLSYVQQGSYDLVVVNNGLIIGTIAQVEVEKKQISDIGARDFCLDRDGDGFNPPLDCNDNNPTVNPNMPESCGDGVDNNCNGSVDEGCLVCTDNDSDGFFAQFGCGSPIDCDDSKPSVNPQATEACDGIDNNCDGQIDESGALGETTYYLDLDSDGYGAADTTIIACSAPSNYVSISGDCDDSNANVYPSATEIEDGIDNDCDTLIDEGFNKDRFNESGSFIVPEGITQIHVELWGGGGAGGAGFYSSTCFSDGYGGGGGGSGGRYIGDLVVTPGETFNIAIGAGGVAGSGSGQNGSSSLMSSDFTNISALGGTGGQSAEACHPGAGGIGGPGGYNGSDGGTCSGGLGGQNGGGDGGSGCGYSGIGKSGLNGYAIIQW